MNPKLLILYGAGKTGSSLIEKLKKLNIPVECFCDTSSALKGSYVSGIVVKSIDAIKAQYKKGEYSIFISIAPHNAEKIKDELISKDIFEASDFCTEESITELILKKLLYKDRNNKEKREQCIALVKKNFILLDAERENALKMLLSPRFRIKSDFSNRIYIRLNAFRNGLIPWLQSIQPIKGSKILEIGCGPGASTVALCEQGANVIAIDIDDEAMEVARKRLEIYGLHAEIEKLNAVDIKKRFNGDFDFIIFTASMEHMTYSERIRSIRAAYDMIDCNNQYIVVTETPNRLWHTDSHTSLESFYHWLPNDLAMDYAQYTKREDFNQGFDRDNEDDVLRFLRWGRGVSYHEFEIAVGSGNLKVASYMNDLFDVPDVLDDLYKIVLRANGPKHISNGFYESSLDIALQKNNVELR